jgi:hypothetical protein
LKRLVTAIVAGLIVAVPMLPARANVPLYTSLLIFPNGTSEGCYLFFASGPANQPLGGRITVQNSDSVSRTVRSEGFWSATLAPGDEKDMVLRASGTYLFTCDGGPAGTPVGAKLEAPGHPATASFVVTWADSRAKSVWRYTVQYQIGSGDFVGWKSNASALSATFHGVSGKVYHFRSRVKNSNTGTTTDWSPSKRVAT